MKDYLKMETHPVACKENIIQGDRYRITVLTSRLLRLEYSEDGVFNDAATQTVLNRDFPKTEYQLKETEEELQLMTEHLQLNYDKKEFTSHGLSGKRSGRDRFSLYSGGVFYSGSERSGSREQIQR